MRRIHLTLCRTTIANLAAVIALKGTAKCHAGVGRTSNRCTEDLRFTYANILHSFPFQRTTCRTQDHTAYRHGIGAASIHPFKDSLFRYSAVPKCANNRPTSPAVLFTTPLISLISSATFLDKLVTRFSCYVFCCSTSGWAHSSSGARVARPPVGLVHTRSAEATTTPRPRSAAKIVLPHSNPHRPICDSHLCFCMRCSSAI